MKSFPAQRDAVAAARTWARDEAARQGWSDRGDVVELLVSELVTNTVEHTRSTTFVVRLQTNGDLETGVYDSSTRPPRVCPAGEWDEGGRGLELVQALSDQWGAQHLLDGKYVWFRLHSQQP